MGQEYPFSYLPHLLGDTQALPEQSRQYWVLLLKSGTRRIAVQVDGLMGNREIVVKNIGAQLARVVGVDGATVLGDGQVVLILNPVALSTRIPVTEFITPVPSAPLLSDEQVALSRLPTIMVVDDSLTVRKITGRLLAREGYQVLVAKDGVEALELLLDVVPDVMLVDIEMPRLDGFDLTRNIRSDPRLKAIPIIMITSRTGDKHRNYAFEIGVNHFMGKPFQEEELLQLVAGYVSQQRSS
jgi:chemosensory pili system protein ChpA (sensor histidine kinase/response regulator)